MVKTRTMKVKRIKNEEITIAITMIKIIITTVIMTIIIKIMIMKIKLADHIKITVVKIA